MCSLVAVKGWQWPTSKRETGGGGVTLRGEGGHSALLGTRGTPHKISSAIQPVHCERMKQYSLQSTALGALNLESILLPENQANAFESAS